MTERSGHLEPANPFPPTVNTIGAIAPARRPETARMQPGFDRLAGWGIRVKAPFLADPGHRYMAATDACRAARLNELIADPEIDLLLAVAGGFGCTRILDDLDWDTARRRALHLVGYSDLTALHLAAFGKGIRSGVFGPMLAGDLARIPESPQEAEDLSREMGQLGRVLAGLPLELSFATPPAMGRDGFCRGPIVPVTLTVLCALLGTRHLPDLTGCILVAEDVHEAAYRIDRCLTQLHSAGILGRLGGLVYGQFTRCEDEEWIPDVLAEWADAVPGPVAAGLRFGHVFPSTPLPVGRDATLRVAGRRADLTIHLAD